MRDINIKKFTELFRKTFSQFFPEILPKFDTKLRTVFDKFWNVIQESLTEEKYLTGIYDQCVKIEQLIEIVRKNFGKIPKHEEKLHGTITDVWDKMGKLMIDRFVAGDRSSRLYNNLEHISKLIVKTSPEKLEIHYGRLQEVIEKRPIPSEDKQALLLTVRAFYGRYQQEITGSQSPPKRKCETSADDQTSEKRQRESENDSETSEKRQGESSDHR